MSIPEPGHGVVLYARFSPRPNASECKSVEKQLERLREWAKAGNYPIKGEFADEAVSGALDKQGNMPPQLAEAIVNLGSGDFLVAINISRFTRDGALLAFMDKAVKKRSAHVYVLDEKLSLDDHYQSFLFKLLCLFYEMDRERQRELCRAARRKRAREGHVCAPGRPRFGWTSIKRANGWEIVINEREQAILKELVDLRNAGRPLKEIADKFNREGKLKRHGGTWHFKDISAVYHRSMNIPEGWPLGIFNPEYLTGDWGQRESVGSDWGEGLEDQRKAQREMEQ